MRISELLDLLATIRKRNDKLVIVTVDMTADFVNQLGVMALEKPNHRTFYRPYAPRP
jgi:hypothetical protein